MLFLNAHHSIANIQKFILGRTGSLASDDTIKATYARILGQAQGTRLSTSSGVNVSFEDNPLGKRAAQQALFAGEGQRLAPPLSDDEKALASRSVDHAFLLLRHLDPYLELAMTLIISDVVCVRVYGSGGGTASNLLGMIWLSPHPRWTTIDYAECLVHEFVHLNVFLGDVVHRIYVDARRVREPGARVISAVRLERRPLDKALHSACVAATLSYLYHLLGDEKTATEFVAPLDRCVAEMKGPAFGYLAPYGQALVSELDEFLTRRDFSWVRERTRSPELMDASTPEDLAPDVQPRTAIASS